MSAAVTPVAVATPDGRGSWVPTLAMISTRLMEMRRRRGLMIALAAVNIGIPTILLTIRLIAHAVAPTTYGPAGGYGVFTALVAGLMFTFGFIVAATLGCSAGSTDLTDGMFRHLVVTGRSRLALYFARIPAGLAIIVPMVAAGFAIVCTVCVLAAPPNLTFQGSTVPEGLSLSGFEQWASAHPDRTICGMTWRGALPAAVMCSPEKGVFKLVLVADRTKAPSPAQMVQLRVVAARIARENYADYTRTFRSPSASLMLKAGLWIELEAIIGFVVGLGLASLMGQRTLPIILMVVLELILTPLFTQPPIAHLVNVQRSLVGVAMARIEPSALPVAMGGGGPGVGGLRLVESATTASLVIVAWLVVWTALGAWRMATRDA